MYARNVTARLAPEQMDEAIQLWQAIVAPSVKQQPGFISGRLQVNRQSGLVRSLGFWETEADLQLGAVEQRASHPLCPLLSRAACRELFEVVADA
jgi:hypothetical protein